MSRPVRLRDHLHAEIEQLAKAEKRSTANMVELLLEQALRLNDPGSPARLRLARGAGGQIVAAAGFITPQGREAAENTMTGNTDPLEHLPKNAPRSKVDDSHFKPDFKR